MTQQIKTEQKLHSADKCNFLTLSTDKIGYLTCRKIKVTTKLDKLIDRSLLRNYISIKNAKYSLAPASQLRDSTAFHCLCY